MSTLTDYIGLVTSEHAARPNFNAVLESILQPFVDNINMLQSLPNKFDLDVAQGVQLDVVGQWIGITRNLREPIVGVYFAFDTNDVGWDQGVWFDPFSPEEGIISLDDETYRILLYFKIAANIWDGGLLSAEEILQPILVTNPGTHFFIQDNLDMTISIGISGVSPSALTLALLTQGYFELRPAAVDIAQVFLPPGPFFGFDNQNYNISGWDTGFWQ